MKKALVIGIDSYPRMPLSGCVNDATLLESILSSDTYGFKTQLILNEIATRSKLREMIEWALSESEFSIIYFSGHGWKKPISTYLVTHDSTPYEEGIDLQYLSNAAKSLSSPNQNILFILDCCHSGDANVRDYIEIPDYISNNDVTLLGGSGRAVIAACKGSELAYEYKFNSITHGAFTHNLGLALQGHASNENGHVTLNAVFDYLSHKLQEDGRQTPVMRGDQEGALILASNVSKLGSWLSPKEGTITDDDAIRLSNELIDRAKSIISQPLTHGQYLTHGHQAACRQFEPIAKWFNKLATNSPHLLLLPRFKENHNTYTYYFKQLSEISPNLHTEKGIFTKLIGQGGFGSVWKFDIPNAGESLCFKAFHAHDIYNIEKVKRFKRGFDSMKQLDHPNIVKATELTELPLGFFMNFIDGPNLRSLNPGHLDPSITIDLLIDVAETIKHAHGRNVVHRDIKPENILVSIDEMCNYTAYLTDFDLSWFTTATQLTKAGEGFGSHYYAAPEQINSPNSGTSRLSTVDSYSFGQLCFFCVCARDPLAFDFDNNNHVFASELAKKWNDSDAAKTMLHLYKNCTKRQPQDRINDFRDICELLTSVKYDLQNAEQAYNNRRFLEQVVYSISGKMLDIPQKTNNASLRSRSGRTEFDVTHQSDSDLTTKVDFTFRLDNLIIDGQTAPQARLIINQRVDEMLQNSFKELKPKRTSGTTASFETHIRIDKVTRNWAGARQCRELGLRVIDILERA